MPRLAQLLALLLLVVALGSPAPAAAAARPGPPPAPTRVVCVDAGHGGRDPGAVYGGIQEKDQTLAIAFRLRDLLRASGFGVVMTREQDLPPAQELTNTQRANICNAGSADTVVAIHLNAAPSDPSVNYFKAFWGKRVKDEAFCQRLTDLYALDLPDGSGPLPKLAVGQFASGVLLKSTGPACLVETVFLSNPQEQAALSDGTGGRQQAIAENLYAGLVAWYSR